MNKQLNGKAPDQLAAAQYQLLTEENREEYLQELDEVCALPEDQQRDAYEEFQDKWNTIIDPTWPSIKARLPKINELIVEGTDLTLGELCQREHWDWRPLPPKLR